MILGIESSCDESALALYEPGKGVIDDWVHSQIVKHSEYGGVVPDIAVLEHLNNFPPLLDLVGKKYNLAEIVSKISVTCGPGACNQIETLSPSSFTSLRCPDLISQTNIASQKPSVRRCKYKQGHMISQLQFSA